MTFYECLLCGRELQLSGRWRYFLTNEWTPTLCHRCEKKFERSDSVNALYQYNEAMQHYLQQYKFGQDVLLAHVFRTEIAAVLKNEPFTIVPIPMHELNKRRRTFAHVDELLRAAHIPFIHKLRKLTTDMMAQKSREQRLAMAQLFEVIDSVNGEKICIVDDIYTTGTTIQHAKTALLEAGAKEVKAWTLIRV